MPLGRTLSNVENKRAARTDVVAVALVCSEATRRQRLVRVVELLAAKEDRTARGATAREEEQPPTRRVRCADAAFGTGQDRRTVRRPAVAAVDGAARAEDPLAAVVRAVRVEWAAAGWAVCGAPRRLPQSAALGLGR